MFQHLELKKTNKQKKNQKQQQENTKNLFPLGPSLSGRNTVVLSRGSMRTGDVDKWRQVKPFQST